VKKAAAALIAVALLLAIGAWLAVNYVDVVVKWTVEHYGPDVVGAKVEVGAVRISPRDGKGSVRGLTIGNPPGFSAARAARFGEMRVALDPATVTSGVVHVRELVIDGADITYEKGARTTNLDVLQANIERYARASSGGTASSDGDGVPAKKRFIVDSLVIRNVRVTMTNTALKGQGLGFDLPEVRLADVGRRQGGLTASQVAAAVASAMQQRIAQKLLTNLDLLRKGGVEGAVDALKGLLK